MGMRRPGAPRPNALAVLLAVLVSGCSTGSTAVERPASRCGWGAPANLGWTVNSAGFEGGPTLSHDGLALYFASDRVGGYGKEDIWVTMRRATTTPFLPPTNLGSTINSVSSDLAPDISADGLSLYFGSDRAGGVGDFDLWVARRTLGSQPFRAPTDLGRGINSRQVDDHPNVSDDGLSLYFTSTRSGGSGDADLWVATRNASSEAFRSAVDLGPSLNTPAFDGEPSISADGLTLFFGSDRAGGLGHRDIWVATRSSPRAPFGPARDLGRPVDGVFEEATPNISSDGRSLFFLSDRPASHFFDLWQSARRTCPGS